MHQWEETRGEWDDERASGESGKILNGLTQSWLAGWTTAEQLLTKRL